MRDLPSGIVTFLFTDIEGSTRLLHEHGAGYADLLGDHRRHLRAAVSRHAGVEVDTQGDAFFVAFADADDALATAAEIVDAEGQVRVRIGIHTGRPIVTDEGYVGLDVHRAARICAAAHGGPGPVSGATRPGPRRGTGGGGSAQRPGGAGSSSGRRRAGRSAATGAAPLDCIG